MDQGANSAETSDDSDTFCTINVQIIVSLSAGERESANSGKKTFRVNGNKYPMSRFGSWVFRSQTDEASKLISEGGLAAAITWGVHRGYDNLVTAWLSDCSKNRFVFEIRKGDQKHILEEISTGKMATSLEGILRSMSNPSYCENVGIKLIKIIQDSDKKIQPSDSAHTPTDSVLTDRLKMERLHQAEVIARHMKSKQFNWALPILKQCLTQENDDTLKLQLLIRIYTCAAHLKNEKELKECLPRLVMTMKLATIPPSEISLFLEEYRDLIELLLSNESVVRALEIGFAYQQIIAKIPDVSERLEARASNIQQLCKVIKCLLQINPGVCLKVEARTYIQRVQDEIDSMKRETYCDTLVQSQCVYYSEFALAEVRKFMDRRIAAVFNDASFEFKRLSSCWADFPFVITRLRQHPEVSKYLADEEFIRTLRKISMKPSLLEKHIKESKIAEAHEVLASEFGLLDSIVYGESANKDVAEEKSAGGTKTESETKPLDKKAASVMRSVIENETEFAENSSLVTFIDIKTRFCDNRELVTVMPLPHAQMALDSVMAKREKELGNEAYKNLNFTKAHEHYDKAIQYDPDDALLHCNKAAVFISQKKFDIAKRACVFALEVSKKDESRYTNKDKAKIIARLAKAEYLDGRRDLALIFYQQSLATFHDPKVIEEMKKCQQAILNDASAR